MQPSEIRHKLRRHVWRKKCNIMSSFLVCLLFPKQLTHPSFPSSTFVQRHTSIFGTSPCKSSALSAKDVDKFFLAQVLHLNTQAKTMNITKSRRFNTMPIPQITPHLSGILQIICYREIYISIFATEFDGSSIIRPTFTHKLNPYE